LDVGIFGQVSRRVGSMLTSPPSVAELSKLPLGRLPGDILVERPGFKLFAPFTSMILVSLLLSLIVWLLRR
jgi:hypothetical protein